MRTIQRWRVAIIAVALLAMMSVSASAQTSEVVAEGLNGPQDIVVASDGEIWIIDGGLGGDEMIEVFDGESGGPLTAGFGVSAQVVRVDPATGEMTQVATLPSYATESGVTGGGGLAVQNGTVYASVGEWIAASPADRPENVGSIVSLSGDGGVTLAADTFAHELAGDSYPYGPPSSHPYGMFAADDGSLLVADAAANVLLSVDVSSGSITTIAVFEPLPGAFPHPAYDGEMLTDPVPTSVTVGADGTTYVSLLSGAPFIPGNAKVMTVADDGTIADFAVGLTMLTDLVTGPDGSLYATQFAIFGEQGPDPVSGAVIKIDGDGTSEAVVEGLSFPTAIDFAPNGDAYVAVGGVGPPGSGQVVRIAGLAGQGDDGQLPTTGTSTILVVLLGATLLAGGVVMLRSRSDFVAHS